MDVILVVSLPVNIASHHFLLHCDNKDAVVKTIAVKMLLLEYQVCLLGVGGALDCMSKSTAAMFNRGALGGKH